MTQTTLNGLKILAFEAVADGYLLAFAAGGSREDARMALAEAARAIASLNPWHRRWLPEERAWWIADDAITLLARQLPPLADLLAEWHQRPPSVNHLLWDDATYGPYSSSYSTSFRHRMLVPPAVALAYRRLGLPVGASVEQVRAARRALARQHHPDTGGEHLTMTAINSAADTVLSWLRQRS